MASAAEFVEAVDGRNVPVTLYPPGRAIGYRDSKNWSQRRVLGMSGVGKIERKIDR